MTLLEFLLSFHGVNWMKEFRRYAGEGDERMAYVAYRNAHPEKGREESLKAVQAYMKKHNIKKTY